MTMRTLTLAVLGAWGALQVFPATAQIRTDATLGQSAQNLTGPNFLIPQSLGKLVGGNLFHSFQTFNVQSGEAAIFTSSSTDLSNVITRVTGGAASSISGQLRLVTAGGAPGFFFINPAGVSFGNGALVSVPGAFHVSTAHYLKFPDGNFYADATTPSTFSSATPEAFGFFAGDRATVQAVNTNPQGGAGQPGRPSLFLGTDKQIQIVAGDITIDNSVIGNESGDVHVIALGQPSQNTEVALSGAHVAGYGDLTIRNGGQINSSTNSAKDVGSVAVYAGDILIDKAAATRDTGIISQADYGASGRTGQLSIVATGDLSLLNGAKISASNSAIAANPSALKPGSVTLMAKNITLDNGQITAETRGNVDASALRIAATGSQAMPLDAADFDQAGWSADGSLTLSNGAAINGNTYLSGKGAPIAIKAGALSLEGGERAALIVASTLNPNLPGALQAQMPTLQATGDGGSIDITANTVRLVRGGQIQSSTLTQGQAGEIRIQAHGMTIDGQNSMQPLTGIFGTANPGSGGQSATVDIDLGNGALVVTRRGGITVQNDATVSAAQLAKLTPSTLSIAAGSIALEQSALITASTSGNVEASRIDMRTTGPVTLDDHAAIQGTTTGSGNASSIAVTAGGDLLLSNGAYINGNTSRSGEASSVTVSAANITLDGKGVAAIISSEANVPQNGADSATGSGNRLDISTPGRLSLINGGQLKSSTNSAGNAGKIRVQANEVDIDGEDNTAVQTGIINTTIRRGDSGEIDLTASGALRVHRLGEINASAYGPAGKAGTIRIQANSLELDGMKEFHGTQTLPDGTVRVIDGFKSSAISSEAGSNSAGQTGDVMISVAGEMKVTNAAKITVSNLANVADPSLLNHRDLEQQPVLTVSAGRLTLDSRATMTASTGGNIDASRVTVSTHAGDIELKNGALLQAATKGAGHAGTIELNAGGNLLLTAGGGILDSTIGAGHAGSVQVRANDIIIDGQAQGLTGIFSTATQNATGHSGEIKVVARGDLSLRGGGQLSVQNDARSPGAAASPSSLQVLARNLSLSGEQTQISAASSGTMDAAQIKIAALGSTLSDEVPDFDKLTTTGTLSVGKGSSINGNTSGSGKGASITIKAGTVRLDGAGGIAAISSESMSTPSEEAAAVPATGDGGSVEVTAARLELINGGQIKTSTVTAGNAGVATLAADSILIDGANNPQILTGIMGSTNNKGDSGKISVSAAQDLSLLRLGQISASTNGDGSAGQIDVQGGTVLVDGMVKDGGRNLASSISAEAGPASSGRTGNLSVTAARSITLSNGGKLSVQNQAHVSPEAAALLNDNALARPRMSINAPDITLIDAQITAASMGNVNASNIDITFSDKLHLDPSAISTSANTGDGGAIDIRGGRLMMLDNSIVSTSVSGLAGFNGNPANGGDIRVAADNLVLTTGFIQANTAASNASGGNVSLELKNLVSSGNALFLGGQMVHRFTPYIFGYNVIQAAAPTGVSGAIQISSPVLDLAGALSGLKAKRVDTGGLGRSPCQAVVGSTFVQAGRGGFAPSARELLGPESPATPSAMQLEASEQLLAPGRFNVECDQR
jgi:filamentous hemagglutinin family protein